MLWFYLALGCALAESLHHLTNKRILEDYDIYETLMIVTFSGFLFMLPILFFIEPFSLKQFGLAIVMSSCGASGALLLNSAYKKCEISSVAPLLNVNPVFVALMQEPT